MTSTSPARRIFWVAACAGIIVFGSLMGAAFISQQFLQNVLGYSTLEAGAAFLPTIVFMVLVAPRSAKLVESHGARFTLLCGYVFLLLAFATMLLLWDEGSAVLEDRPRLCVHRDRRRVRRHARLALADRFGARATRRDGVRHGRPAARPRRRDHAVDLRRAAHRRLRRGRRRRDRRRARTAQPITDSENQLTKSFAGAEAVAQQYPQYATQITAAAKQSFLDGDQWAYTAGIVAVAARRGARVLHVPAEGRRAATPRRLPRRGRRERRAPRADGRLELVAVLARR